MRTMEDRLAARLAELRAERGWSLDDLADRSGVSRSTLSRVERGEISPTASLLGRLCTVYERPMSRLLTEVEADGAQLIRSAGQSVWTDEDSGFVRRSVSPPHPALRAEVVEGTLRPGADLSYDAPSVPGLEQHLWMLDGALDLTVDGRKHALVSGDCLRFRLWGPTRFHCPGPGAARYLLVLVMP
ncbi:transcriptional regulator with XRE-family HTH domain [Amycolatopsis endophytica]|uniref:Transcriptional regulator with XRE-family HTH domain n=2 Tax=Amycolatopsis endophytica TaxID=860233 RepID=A0A853BFN2_9PSEU|nr:transcriptional regulator with XRE-family HTH domain [Amycolatopsis endophytica]